MNTLDQIVAALREILATVNENIAGMDALIASVTAQRNAAIAVRDKATAALAALNIPDPDPAPPAPPQKFTVRNNTGAPDTASPGAPVTLSGDAGSFTIGVQETASIPGGVYELSSTDAHDVTLTGNLNLGIAGYIQANGGALEFIHD